MNLPARLVSDKRFKLLLFFATGLILDGALLSQLIMQVSGGPRNEAMDFSEQVPEEVAELAIFPDGLPPFISSGGIFVPEKIFFNIGIGLGGLLFCLCGIELFLRTHHVLRQGRSLVLPMFCTLGQCLMAILVGGCLFMLTHHPFDVSFKMHVLYANSIFYGSLAWGLLLILSRMGLDRELSCRGWPLNRLRWLLLMTGIICFALMLELVMWLQFNAAALFEWLMTFSTLGLALTLLPIVRTGESQASG